MTTTDTIDDALWRRARELAASPEGLTIEGLGTFRGGRLDHHPEPRVDAPKLVVQVADETGASDDDVRGRLRAAVKQAVDSSLGHPAPLGGLGLLEQQDGQLRFHPSKGGPPAPPGAVDAALEAWRAPADDAAARVAALVEALEQIEGRLPPADQARLLDEVGYGLDPDGWRRFGGRILAALPF